MLSGVCPILSSERHLKAFKFYLQKRPEVIPHINALWTITPGSVHRVHTVCVDIITTCTSLRSLACHPQVLTAAICHKPTVIHAGLVDLTMIELSLIELSMRISWQNLMHFPSGGQFLHQLERLHLIGPLDAWAVFPKLNNLTRASIEMGLHRRIPGEMFREMVKSPKLEQVVLTTRLHGEERQSLLDVAQEMDGRFSVVNHRKLRWKESNLWHESLQDPDRL
ncbi:hypothetical protein B0H11DRAFT_241780 [Mycena galericulata]|nr:hypothetical protein B0H11DRAFT_241780 [Mycena galericulata]